MFGQYARQLNYLDLILKNKKVPHAFLFYGRDTAAQADIAKAVIFLANNPEACWDDFKKEPAGDVYAIKMESHPDVYIVRRGEEKKSIGIEQIRELKNFVSQSPFSLKIKAAIVTEAHALTEESWNALLKTLEEPAGRTLIFLISRGVKNIPKTILSRSLAVPFFDSSAASRLTTKDDIILKKLANIAALGILERLELAERISAVENKLEILDGWLLFLRAGLLKGETGLSVRVENIAQAKNILAGTNANPRLVLENLLLNI